MGAALGSPWDPTGAAHVPGRATQIRVEGFAGSVAYRTEKLRGLLSRFGEVEAGEAPPVPWADIRDCAPLAGRPGAVWRLSVRPTEAPGAVAAIRRHLEAEALYDWGGGLVWALTSEDDEAGARWVRAAAEAAGGHATLVRAPDGVRAAAGVFHPQPGLDGIAAALRAKFDPKGVLNPGRMAP
jgi:glycolate oxidase FAD binding subunit